MAAYAVTDYVSSEGTVAAVAADLETKMETIDDTKTIRLTKIFKLPNKLFVGIIMYDA